MDVAHSKFSKIAHDFRNKFARFKSVVLTKSIQEIANQTEEKSFLS